MTNSSNSAEWREADVFSALYDDLRRLAHARLNSGPAPPTLLDTTSLVHESYLRLLRAGRLHLERRGEFLAYASRVMRSVIVDFARESAAARRGGGVERVPLDPDTVAAAQLGASEILRVHDALDQLAAVSDRLAQVVEMRYFGGMTESEIGSALGLTERTVRRDWEKARLLLFAALK